MIDVVPVLNGELRLTPRLLVMFFLWLYVVETSDDHPFIDYYYMYVLKSLNGQWTDTVVSKGNGLVQVNQVNVYSAGTGD